MAYFGPHAARALELLTVAAGEAGYTVPLGHFRLPAGDLETCEPDAAERAVAVELSQSRPVGGYQNPLDGRDLREAPLVVRVGYRFHEEGDLDAGVDAARLGGADRRSIEARASEDAAVILAAVGWQPNWSGLDPHVVDCAPDPAGWALGGAPVNGRLILTVPFVLTTRADFPGSYGPSAT